MKKILVIMAMAFGLSAGVQAQDDSKMAVGINLNAGVGDSYTNFGAGAKFQYKFHKHWRSEASFNYFFKKDYLSMWDANIDAHYLIPIGSSGLTIYPLAGFTVRGAKVSIDEFGINASVSETGFGVNYGAGIEYPVSNSFKLNFEMKGQTAGCGMGTRGIFSIGCAYCF